MHTNDITAAIAKLTPKGLKLMTDVGNQRFSYFDDGIVEGSGIWGECLSMEMGGSVRSNSGIMSGTKKLGLWETSEDVENGSGLWWHLTELGAAVASYLYIQGETPAEPVITKKVGAKWTYVYSDGELIAELRNDQVARFGF